MFLFKSSGATYRQVVRQGTHAFASSPSDIHGDELVLLSKNREDCHGLERQIQYLAKVSAVTKADATELDQAFPGVAASTRWEYAISLYEVRPLSTPFNLHEIPGFQHRRYDQVQSFARIRLDDAGVLITYLQRTNTEVLLHYLNQAIRPECHNVNE